MRFLMCFLISLAFVLMLGLLAKLAYGQAGQGAILLAIGISICYLVRASLK